MNEMTQLVQSREALSQAKQFESRIKSELKATKSKSEAAAICKKVASEFDLQNIKIVSFPMRSGGARMIQFTLPSGRTFLATFNYEPA